MLNQGCLHNSDYISPAVPHQYFNDRQIDLTFTLIMCGVETKQLINSKLHLVMIKSG